MFFPTHVGTSLHTQTYLTTNTAVCSCYPILLLVTSKISIHVEIEQKRQNFI